VAFLAALHIPDCHQSASQQAKANHASLAIIATHVLKLENRPGEHAFSISKINAAVDQRGLALDVVSGQIEFHR
jgi:hypothetical protein